MKKLFKSRIFIFILGLLIPIVIVAMIVYFFGEEEEVFEMNVDDFTIEGNAIINEKEGLTVTIPDEWTAKKAVQAFFSEWGVHIFSPDISVRKYVPSDLYVLDDGCVILVNIEQAGTLFKLVTSALEGLDENVEISSIRDEREVSIMMLDNKLALKEVIYDKPDFGKRVDVRVPIEDDKLICLIFISSETKKDACYEIFDDFSKKILINN